MQSVAGAKQTVHNEKVLQHLKISHFITTRAGPVLASLALPSSPDQLFLTFLGSSSSILARHVSSGRKTVLASHVASGRKMILALALAFEQSKGELVAANEYEYTACFLFCAVNLKYAELDITLARVLFSFRPSKSNIVLSDYLCTCSSCEPFSFRPSNLNIELSREGTKLKQPFPARNLNFCTNLLPKEGIKLKPLWCFFGVRSEIFFGWWTRRHETDTQEGWGAIASLMPHPSCVSVSCRSVHQPLLF